MSLHTHTHTHTHSAKDALGVVRKQGIIPVLLMGLVLVSFFSCKKEPSSILVGEKEASEMVVQEAKKLKGETFSETPFLVEDVVRVIDTIGDKALETTIDEVEWALNRVFGEASSAFVGIARDTMTYHLDLLENDSVPFAGQIDLLEYYLQQILILESGFSDTRIMAVDILKKEALDKVYRNSTDIIVVVLSISNEVMLGSPMCKFAEGNHHYSTAAERIGDIYNMCPLRDVSSGMYYKSVVSYSINSNPLEPTPEEYLDFVIYISSNHNGQTTLASTLWDQYVSNLKTHMEGIAPYNDYHSWANLKWDYYKYNNVDYYYHKGVIGFGEIAYIYPNALFD